MAKNAETLGGNAEEDFRLWDAQMGPYGAEAMIIAPADLVVGGLACVYRHGSDADDFDQNSSVDDAMSDIAETFMPQPEVHNVD